MGKMERPVDKSKGIRVIFVEKEGRILLLLSEIHFIILLSPRILYSEKKLFLVSCKGE